MPERVRTESLYAALERIEHACARHDRTLYELGERVDALGVELAELARIGAADRQLAELRDRHEQLAARVRIFEGRGES